MADSHYGDQVRLALDVAAALNAEARELAALGVDAISSTSLRSTSTRCARRQAGAFRPSSEPKASDDTAVICYGYGIKANVDWKATLGDEAAVRGHLPWPGAIGQVSLECAASRVPLRCWLLDGKGVLAGVIDVAATASDA